MVRNLFNAVSHLLLTVDDYIAEDGKILKAKVYEDTMLMKPNLIKMLITNEDIKGEFFVDIDGTLIFDKQKFLWFLELKEFLPNSYTRFKNKIGLTDRDGNYILYNNDVVLSFPYKDCILKGGQDKEDQKRDEIFYNETIASDEISRMLEPKVFTNAKRYTKDGIEENIEFKDNDNLIIKGNNLIALSSLLKRYEGKVKCIYIDPPYYFSEKKDEDDFKYNSNFKLVTWLTFMKNRLEIAKSLLVDGGFFIVQINDNVASHLKLLLDDIFFSADGGFLNNVIVKMSDLSGPKMAHINKKIPKIKENILI